jgi:predicted O-methyltransferase YrrM
MVFTVDWFTKNIPLWKNIFESTKIPENVLEIGSFEGRSTCWILENTQARVTCVDTWEGSDEHTEEEKSGLFDRFEDSIKNYRDRISIHRGFSGEVLRQFPCDSTFDFIYIDGSHYSKDVLEDAILSWRLLKPGGVIVFDDFNWQLPGTDINDLKNPRKGIETFCHIFQPILLVKSDQLVIQKKV